MPGAVFICAVFITLRNDLVDYFYEDEARHSLSVQNQGHILQCQRFGHLADGVSKLFSSLSGLKSNASQFRQVCQPLLKMPENCDWKNLALF